jgi:hypothetical protein
MFKLAMMVTEADRRFPNNMRMSPEFIGDVAFQWIGATSWLASVVRELKTMCFRPWAPSSPPALSHSIWRHQLAEPLIDPRHQLKVKNVQKLPLANLLSDYYHR